MLLCQLKRVELMSCLLCANVVAELTTTRSYMFCTDKIAKGFVF